MSNTVIVTGAFGAIGWAITQRLIEGGWHVIAVDRTTRSVDQPELEPYALDITNETDVEQFFASLSDARRSSLTGLINAAGVNVRSDAIDCTAEVFNLNLSVNLLGTFLMCRETARSMQLNVGGSIVNIASTMAFVGSKRSQAAYAASKGGVVALTRALAVEWAPFGVRVNAIAPAFVDTPMNAPITSDAEKTANVLDTIPLGRFGQPIDTANASAWLLGDESSFVTGHVLRVDGGYLAL